MKNYFFLPMRPVRRAGHQSCILIRSMQVLFIFLLFIELSLCQTQRRNTLANRISNPPQIDGQLDDQVWSSTPILTDFQQWSPNHGNRPSQPTEYRVGYDNTALYIGIVCYDSSPDSMMSEITQRDQRANMRAELVGVHISPYDDGIHSVFFDVTIANVQRDIKFTGDHGDHAWDAVWESAVARSDSGWTAEIRIPFSALRFSSADVQNWGFNIWRWIARKREWSNWSPVSNEISGWWKESGRLDELSYLDPPIRLSFTPYVSGYVEKDESSDLGYSYNGGLDLKYGVSEGFTLDMTLIPDFGQVQSDDERLNLSPYEIRHNERRQFFTEGTELFNKANLFYSRRIGSRPVDYYAVPDELGENEMLSENPHETRLINATKFSGRTSRGLGIGVLNAMTARSQATITDTVAGTERKVTTQPFTNYNLLVVDKTLFANSYVSLINSNVSRSGYGANVTATEMKFADADNHYSIKGVGAVSHISNDGSGTTGYKLSLEGGKVGGTFQSVYSFSRISPDYQQNDLGYLRRTNEMRQRLSLAYRIFNPFSIFLNMTNRVEFQLNRMVKPNAFAEFNIAYIFDVRLKNQYHFHMHALVSPVEGRDYFEPRTEDRYLATRKLIHNCFVLSTDQRKSLTLRLHSGFSQAYDYQFDALNWSLMIEPGLRINNNFRLGYDWMLIREENMPGFISNDMDDGTILFGKRDRMTLTNTFAMSYVMDHRTSLSLRLRHYWSKADYDGFYSLLGDGSLDPYAYSENHDVNYNAFNIDMTFRWIFAPGSEILINWKNAICTQEDRLVDRYWDNLRNTWEAPQVNSFSVKLLYYLDYATLFRR